MVIHLTGLEEAELAELSILIWVKISQYGKYNHQIENDQSTEQNRITDLDIQNIKLSGDRDENRRNSVSIITSENFVEKIQKGGIEFIKLNGIPEKLPDWLAKVGYRDTESAYYSSKKEMKIVF